MLNVYKGCTALSSGAKKNNDSAQNFQLKMSYVMRYRTLFFGYIDINFIRSDFS